MAKVERFSNEAPQLFGSKGVGANYKDKDQYIEQRPNATEKEAREDVARLKREAKEKAGFKEGGNMPNPATLMADMEKKLYKWGDALEVYSTNRDALTGSVIANIRMALQTLATMLLGYKDKFKTTTGFKEGDEPEADHEHEIIVPPPQKRKGHDAD